MLSRTVHAWNIDITWKHYKNKLMVKWWKCEWKDWNSENLFHSEIAEVVLAHCNIVNKDYRQNLIILYTFIPNKSFGQLLGISRKTHFAWNILKHGSLIKILNR